MRTGKLIGLVTAALMMGFLLVGGQAPASPGRSSDKADVGVLHTGQNGVCEVGEVCLYDNSGCSGSSSDFGGRIDDFAGYRFISSGNGRGQALKNNAASARN